MFAGLLIKQMLIDAKNEPHYEKMVENSKGIVFYSVPHYGSPLAAYTKHTKFLVNPSIEVNELKQGC